MKAEKRMRIMLPCMVVFWCSFCFSQIIPGPPADTDRIDPIREYVKTLQETPFVTKAVLRNGLKILVNENRAHPVVSIQVFVEAGVFDEPPDTPGLASLITAMVYRATPDESAGSSVQNARMLGGFLDSSTEYGHARFEILAPATQWEKALQVQSQALLNFSLDSDDVKMEARSLREEALGRLDNPFLLAKESFLGLGFSSSRMGIWSSVLNSDLDAVSDEKMIAFHREMYVPERMMVVISGDVNAIEVLNEAARLYGVLPASGKRSRSIPVTLSQKSFRYRGIRGRIPVSHLFFGFHAPAADSDDYPAMEVLSAVLGLGNGSILAARLRDQKKVIFDGATELFTHPEFGYLTIHVKTAPEDIDRSEIAVLTELELLKRKEPVAADMERAWAQLEREYRNQIETVSGRARLLARFESWGDWKRIDRHMADLRKVQASDVKRVAIKYLRMENCSLFEYVPETVDIQNRTVDAIRATLQDLLTPAANQEQNLRERETVFPFEIPDTADDYKFSWIRYSFLTASILRGPEIFIREDHASPLVHLGIFFPGGRFDETERNSGITGLMVRMMIQSAEKKMDYRFHRQLEIYGGQLLPVVEDDYFGFYFSILSKNFHPGFNLLMDVVKSPVFEADALDRQKVLLSAQHMQYRSWKDSADDAILPILFNSSPYAGSHSGSDKFLQTFTTESLEEWYEKYIKDRKPVVAIVGDCEGTNLADYFGRHFSGSRFQETELAEKYPEPLEKKESIETAWDRNLSLVSIGFQAPPTGDPDRYAAEVLQSDLGNSGKIYHEIMERLGMAHILSLYYEPRLRAGSFIAYAVVSPGNEEAVLGALEKEFQRTATGVYGYRDYRSAVNTAVGAFQLRQQIPLLQIMDVTQNILAGEGIEGYRSFQTKLKSVPVEDLESTAERIFKTEREVSLRIYSKPLNRNDSKAE
jgi:zinc protease